LETETEISDDVLDGRDKSITETTVRNSAVLPQTVDEDSLLDSFVAHGIRLQPQQTALYDAYHKNDIKNRIFTQFIDLRSSHRFVNSVSKVRQSSDL